MLVSKSLMCSHADSSDGSLSLLTLMACMHQESFCTCAIQADITLLYFQMRERLCDQLGYTGRRRVNSAFLRMFPSIMESCLWLIMATIASNGSICNLVPFSSNMELGK